MQRVFIWMDIDSDGFKHAQQSQLVAALRDAVIFAAQWTHIAFVVLPVPWTASLLHVFEPFMQAFNMVSTGLPNVVRFSCIWFRVKMILEVLNCSI